MKIIEIFDEVVTLREYDEYFYSIGQPIAIITLAVMSGLKKLPPKKLIICSRSKLTRRKDSCRITDKKLQRNLNLFRKFLLNKLYKEKHSPKSILSHIMLECLINPLHLRKLLFEN